MRKVFLLFFLLWQFTAAQQPFNLAFNHLNHEGGLSNNNVFYMHHDSRGYMWFSTLNGLTRFDGTTCKVYKGGNAGLRGNAFKNIMEDKAGNLWIGSDEGLNFYDRRKDTFSFVTIKGIDKYEAYPYTIDDKGMIWLHLGDEKLNGLCIYDPISKKIKLISRKSATNFSELKKQEYKPVKTYYTAGPSDIGFYKVSIDNYKEIKAELFFDGKNRSKAFNHIGDYLYAENDSTVWISGDNGLGLIKFNPYNKKFKVYNSALKSYTRLVSFKNYLIMGSNQGLFIFDKKKEKFVQHIGYSSAKANGTSSDYAEILYLDKEGNLFASNLGPGLDYTNLNRKILEHWLDPETSTALGYKQNDIYDIKKGDNEIFVKYQTGPTIVLDLQGKHKRTYRDRSTLLVDTDKRQWFYEVSKLIYFDPSTNKETILNFKELEGSIGYELQLIEISDDNFVYSCKKGLFEFNLHDKNIKPISLGASNAYLIKPLFYDTATKQIFAITNFWSNLQILKKQNGIWQTVKKLESIYPYAVRPSKDTGFVWLCTRIGLKKLNTKTFEMNTLLEKHGIPDNFVSDFLEEPNGDHWMVTSKGISHYVLTKRLYRNFTSKDGAYSSEYDWGAAIKLDDGRTVFGGTNGLTVITPEILKEEKYTPTVQISNFTVHGKVLKNTDFLGEKKSIVLEPEQNTFAFNMVGIDYKSPKNINIFYKLSGYDTEWITAANPSEARYTNVPEGNYTFMLKAGFFNEYGDIETKSYEIFIKTPFQRTWWFRTIMAALICGLGYSFYRFRINQILRLQEVRNRISIDLHDEIGATLSGIGILSAVAKQKMAATHPAFSLLGRINEDAQTIGNSIDDIVWSVNPKNDELGNVISRMSRNAAEIFDAKGIEYKIDTPETIKEIKLSLEQRRDLYLIYKEAVNNLVKYANCTFVNINMQLKNNMFTLEIIDNGIGFDPKIITGRNGLNNMKTRARKLGGTLSISSELNKGTSIKLSFNV